MKVDKELIKKVATNARLKLTESEIREFLPQLKEVLKDFDTIQKAPTKNLEPSFQPLEIKNITREDKVEACLTQEDSIKNAKHKSNGYIKGPKAI
ncbi:MAG: Asp-tRNA(Asn)/Glu-tRNA(Gln) amidotransferase GatCAB subunit C [Nanoarchaeota archaeon]|nr:Asp-tRNA(Asn)/Glu-tRNA(Gln) amidotransferase GatCAB subunit C [Nanoarchaeota archaeon]|tara:strand:+ start:163 stop:447 length:285 start_codon:yes stop_codon:yes gene_type:complete